MGLFSRSKKKKAKSNNAKPRELSEADRNATFRRASTSQVTLEQLRSRMQEIEGILTPLDATVKNMTLPANGESITSQRDLSMQKRKGSSCLDLSQSVLDFIPTPLDNLDVSDHHDSSTVGRRIMDKSAFLGLKEEELKELEEDTAKGSVYKGDFLSIDPTFDSFFSPEDMRCLALVSHNNMKEAMKQFVLANKNVLKKFRLTGTNTTMSMLKEVFGDDPSVRYGPACKSGPLGGDAQLVAMAVTGQVGGCIFFIDPMDAHPHSADIECLVRQGNVHNLLMLNNPTTAHVALNALRVALKMGRMEMFPSFFFDLESPSVAAYKIRQQNILQNAIGRIKRKSIIAQADKQAKTIQRDIKQGKTYYEGQRA